MPAIDPVRIQTLFAAALELPEDERGAWLERECAGDQEAMRELRSLLTVDAQLSDRTLRSLAPQLTQLVASAAPADSMIGLRIGPFELREELGRGGMGSVYRGERVDGAVTQQVAIKFIRRELLDANTLRRFQMERQTLASLDHPNIARLLDAAELADGTPYFVMEYVAGKNLIEHCDQAQLNLRERVALFRVVCAAVMEAHRNLIVHRDLKPGNILVSESGAPKLLDFGIAKPLTTGVDTLAQEQTGTAHRYFSPLYSAPEQLLGGTIGVGCDVYALGLLLYELLAGTRPFDFAGLTSGEIERLVTAVPPVAPSVAAARTHAPVLQRQLRGELDDIVLRCLRKAPGERYASVEQLDADLANYLEGRPVQASGGHGWYRARKFIGRNKIAVVASALTAISLIAGITAFAWQARIATEQADIAKQRAAELEQVAAFQAEMLSQVDPAQAGLMLTEDINAKLEVALTKSGVKEDQRAQQLATFSTLWRQINATDAARDLIDRTILKPAVAAIDKQFKDQPLVDARLSETLAMTYRVQGNDAASLPLQRRAYAIRLDALGERHLDTMASMSQLGAVLMHQGKHDEAEPYWERVLILNRTLLGEEHVDTLRMINNLGFLRLHQGRIDEAAANYREALERRRRALGPYHPDTLTSINNMGMLLGRQGKHKEAEPYFLEALAQRRRILGEAHQLTMTSINNLGINYFEQRKLEDAESYFREALDTRRRMLGAEHPSTLASLGNLGEMFLVQGRISTAEPYITESYEKSRLTREADDPLTLSSIHRLGMLRVAQRRLDEAEPYLRMSMQKRREVLGEWHPDTLRAFVDLASLYVDTNKHVEAKQLLTSIETATKKMFTEDNAYVFSKLKCTLGRAHLGLGEFSLAESKLHEAHAVLASMPDRHSRDRRAGIEAIVDLYTAWHKVAPTQGHDVKAEEWKAKLEKPGSRDAETRLEQPTVATKNS